MFESKEDGVEVFREVGEVLAIVLRADFEREGIAFLTPDSYSLQLGYMKRPEGWNIRPHQHRPANREIAKTSEALFVRSGSVRVFLFGVDGEPCAQVDLLKGDIILLVSGGHGFEFLEPSQVVEVKQGPYLGVDDKVYLDESQ